MATEKEKSDGGLILPAHLRREEQERVNKALANDPLTVNVSWDPDEGSVTVIYNHPVQVVKMYAEEARKIGRGLIKAAKNAEAKDDKDAAS